MLSNQITPPIGNLKSHDYLSENEQELIPLHLDSAIYNHLKRTRPRFSTNKATSSQGGTLNEILTDNPNNSSSEVQPVQPYSGSFAEIKVPRSSLTKTIKKYLMEESNYQSSPRKRIRCSSLKRVSAKEICTASNFRYTLLQTKKAVILNERIYLSKNFC